MTNKIIINVYDFDKTIYNGDSTINFYLFCIKKNPIILILLPVTILYFILYKCKIVNKLKFKEKFFLFLKFVPNIDDMIELFWNKNIKKFKSWFNNDKSNNKIIISASPEFLLKPIINKIGAIDIIASKVDKSTGRFNSQNCYGEEKVRRLNEKYNNYIIENFYSDSLSDIFLAQISKNSYLVKRDNISKWNIE